MESTVSNIKNMLKPSRTLIEVQAEATELEDTMELYMDIIDEGMFPENEEYLRANIEAVEIALYDLNLEKRQKEFWIRKQFTA